MSLAESLLSMITPNVVAGASKYFGEAPGPTERGLGAAMSTVLAGATRYAASDGGASLAGLMKENAVDPGTLGNIAGVLSRTANGSGNGTGNGSKLASSGPHVLSELFGSRTAEISSAIESFAGVKGSTASSMLGMAGPIVMGFLSRQQASQGLTASGLAGQLTAQRDSLMRLLPPGVGTLLGFDTPVRATAAPPPSQGRPHAIGFAAASPTAVHHEAAEQRWLIPLIIIAALLALGALLTNRARRAAPTFTNVTLTTVQLPNGSSIDLLPGSFNYNLATFLGNGSAAELPRTFVLDTLNFPTGSAQIEPESAPALAALATILNAYPNATVALAGHTDNTGDADANRKLSLDRANSVRDQLVAAGVDSSRVTAEGYGQDRPVASNDTEEGRAKNRRLELTVTRK